MLIVRLENKSGQELFVVKLECNNKFQTKTWKQTHNKSFLFRFKSHKTVSTSYTVQAVSNDSIHAPFKRIHNCNSNLECYLMHLRNQNQRSQTGGVYLSLLSQSVVNQQSQHQVHRAFSAMTVPISLSLSTPVPKLPGKTKLLQASVSRSPVQKSVKPHCSYTLPNLRCSTTHVLFPDYIIFSSHTCGNPILS